MLPREFRLRSRGDFKSVYSRSKIFATPRLVMHIRPRRSNAVESADAVFRVGFSVSKKTAKKAHDRNLLKRRLSEIVRTDVMTACSNLDRRWDIVIQARSQSIGANYSQLQTDVLRLFEDAALISSNHLQV